MKALVPAGGSGTRLRPITHTSAKQLVPVANKPILDYGLESIARAGITDVGIIVGETHEQIRAHVGDGSRLGIDVTYIHQPAPLGLAHCVLTAADYLGASDFVMYLGDNVLTGGIERFVRQFEARRPTAQILLAKVGDPERYGVAELDGDGHVVRLVEKPKVPRSDLALVGVYLFSPRILDAARSITPSARGELEITDAIQWLIDRGEQVESQIIDGWWKDTGKRYDLLEANRTVLDALESRIAGEIGVGSEVVGRVVVEEGAELVNSVVRGPAIIGAGTRLVNTFVGPYTAIAAGCLIENSEIEHSVILAHTVIRDIRRIEDSLIGREVEVGLSQRKPRAYRLMLGDHSHVELP
ncbi:MAG: glucose-1-phosphate thymidylyltransferase [Egibacteraceae bacterium]